MKIAFDLDGVVVRSILPILRLLNLIEDPKLKEELWKYYYKGQQMELDPRKFLCEGDELIFITGRKKQWETYTRKFLDKYFKDYKLVMLDVDDPVLENVEDFYTRQAKEKAKIINELSIDVYFEDVPEVVMKLRKLCPNTKIILYGDRLE